MLADGGKTKTPPKGVPRGGARFPRYALKEALAWTSKLATKTHSAAQSAEIIYASVVNSKGVRGEIKVSALRQFGLIEGTNQALAATDLAKSIAFAPENELPALYAKAALNPGVFSGVYETFSGGEVSYAKLRQRAIDLKIHPDNAAEFLSVYLASLELAHLLTVDGDKVLHASKPLEVVVETFNTSEDNGLPGHETKYDAINEKPIDVEPDQEQNGNIRPPRAIFNVNVNLDSSLDTDKLERQLALLKRYGAI